MITLQPINENNIYDVLELKASEDLVAPNSISLAEAFCTLEEVLALGKPHLRDRPFAILHGETIVGFTMVTFEDGRDVNAGADIFWMGRFMIDENHQGKGYGTAAVAALIDIIKTKPDGCDAKYFYTAYVPGNIGAEKAYAANGFEKTGQIFEGEEVVRLVL